MFRSDDGRRNRVRLGLVVAGVLAMGGCGVTGAGTGPTDGPGTPAPGRITAAASGPVDLPRAAADARSILADLRAAWTDLGGTWDPAPPRTITYADRPGVCVIETSARVRMPVDAAALLPGFNAAVTKHGFGPAAEVGNRNGQSVITVRDAGGRVVQYADRSGDVIVLTPAHESQC